MASVDIRSVVKRFGSTQILHGIDVTIEDRSFVVLLGPSGCGKSTLLRMIAGLEQVSEGEIAIGGLIVNDVAPKNRDVAMVFQNYALYPHMKVFDNMAFSLMLAKVDQATIKEKVWHAAEILNLTAYLDRYPRQLSGGQRQRVAMGRAIVRNPQVFLFDEPLSNLDAQLRVQMRTEIKALHQRLGSTSVYVTHDQIEAMTMADKIVVMRDGRIEQAGPPLEVYDRPCNLFVAAFIGSSVFNTLVYTTVATIAKFALGLWLALLLNKAIPFKAFIRAIVLLPYIVPTVLSAIAFWWIYDPQFSIISWTLRELGLIDRFIDFLGTPWNARWSVIVANVWRGIPFVAICLLAGLQTISPSLYEAAALDGANPWQRFRYVTAPLLMPILAVVLTFSVLFTFTDFQLIYAITRGGPLNATHLMATLAFQRAIPGGDLGQGAAIATAMIPFLVAATVFSYYGLQRRKWQQGGVDE